MICCYNEKICVETYCATFFFSCARYPHEAGMRFTESESGFWDNVAALPGTQLAADPIVARTLGWMAQTTKSQRVLEIGTFRGSTTLTLAKCLPPNGTVVTCDNSGKYVLQELWSNSDVGAKIELRQGPIMETLEQLVQENAPPQFDMVVIDDDKRRYRSDPV